MFMVILITPQLEIHVGAGLAPPEVAALHMLCANGRDGQAHPLRKTMIFGRSVNSIAPIRCLIYSWWEASMVRSSQPIIIQSLEAEAATLGLSVGRRVGEPRY